MRALSRLSPLWKRGAGQREQERAARSGVALGPDAAAKALDDPPAGGESDAASLVVTRAAGEHLEDLRRVRQADAVVANREGPTGFVRGGPDRHERVGAVAELQRVGDQVLEDAMQVRPATGHHG